MEKSEIPQLVYDIDSEIIVPIMIEQLRNSSIEELQMEKNKPRKVRRIEVTDSIVDSVIDMFVTRASFGEKKYGVTLDRSDLSLRDWCQHLLEEKMDEILYIKKIIDTLDGEKTGS